ncbi:MAG: helix-turn-helix transcriptional regulator [Desulfovibrio sp.]|uniref:helix-turn-helix transcriptional regulator n=1 Tax=Desulfovibrio sp. TaxID=885 RepID=UPI001A6E3C49|nr:helix-turn-helix transcriptional regulator [Desulfovibrio sp.]MBD5418371.1 helix-turn-helix transcriptional regulator [Desulfovibrio sp.]
MRVFTLTCPAGKREVVLGFLRQNGCQVEERDSIPAEEVFPAVTPGTVIRGLRSRDSLTQEALAKLTGIPRRHISEMENGKRPIGKQNARKLAAAFNTDARMFLSA